MGGGAGRRRRRCSPALNTASINFHMGTLIGFKALTAALLGGIGSLPGALPGRPDHRRASNASRRPFIGSQWKDIAVFALLVLVLLCRPAGMLGHAADADGR